MAALSEADRGIAPLANASMWDGSRIRSAMRAAFSAASCSMDASSNAAAPRVGAGLATDASTMTAGGGISNSMVASSSYAPGIGAGTPGGDAVVVGSGAVLAGSGSVSGDAVPVAAAARASRATVGT